MDQNLVLLSCYAAVHPKEGLNDPAAAAVCPSCAGERAWRREELRVICECAARWRDRVLDVLFGLERRLQDIEEASQPLAQSGRTEGARISEVAERGQQASVIRKLCELRVMEVTSRNASTCSPEENGAATGNAQEELGRTDTELSDAGAQQRRREVGLGG